MKNCLEIYCLNKRHSDIVSSFLNNLECIMDECTYYNEDLDGFTELINDFIFFHNGLGTYALGGEIDYQSWYLSLPQNVYWATKGYFASLTLKKGENIEFFQEKVLSLVLKTIKSLDASLIIHPGTESENKINLN